MSLFIGNLSQRVRKEELERVFQRFGRCTVQVKDGYGFAVYGIRAQAETALRQLRGKRICGAILTLSWSNKQPRPLQSFTRDDRIHKMHGGGRGSFVRRDGGQFPDRQRFNGRRDYQFNQRQLDDGRGRRLDSAEMPAERERLMLDHEGHDGGQSHRDNFRDSAGDSFDRNGLGAGRWDDDGDKGSSDNGMEFERYEPDHESEEKAEGNQIKDSQGDEEIGRVETRTEQIGELGRNYSDSQRDIDSCSKCGSLGHNMQDCPRLDVSGSKIFENSRTRGIPGMEFIESKPRTQEFSRNGASDEQYRSGSKDIGSGNPGSINRVVQGGHRLTAHGKELGLKRHIEKEAATSTLQHHGRRAKKSVLSSHKYRYASRSVSTSSKSSSSSASSSFRISRSKSSSSYSAKLNHKSDRVRSGGTQNARSKQPRSRSNSPVSISLHQPVSSSSHPPHKPEIDLNHGPNVDIVSVEIVNNDRKADHLGSNGDANHQYSRPAEESRTKKEHNQTLGVEGGVKLMPELDTSSSKVSTHHQPPDYSIYPAELAHVLKHYNLEPNVEGLDLSTEEYFGCSRLWPWGIIYYRRLKKGAVSIENYARRLAQNREYGITDKYVRSSSGWGELTLEGC